MRPILPSIVVSTPYSVGSDRLIRKRDLRPKTLALVVYLEVLCLAQNPRWAAELNRSDELRLHSMPVRLQLKYFWPCLFQLFFAAAYGYLPLEGGFCFGEGGICEVYRALSDHCLQSDESVNECLCSDGGVTASIQ